MELCTQRQTFPSSQVTLGSPTQLTKLARHTYLHNLFLEQEQKYSQEELPVLQVYLIVPGIWGVLPCSHTILSTLCEQSSPELPHPT